MVTRKNISRCETFMRGSIACFSTGCVISDRDICCNDRADGVGEGGYQVDESSYEFAQFVIKVKQCYNA